MTNNKSDVNYVHIICIDCKAVYKRNGEKISLNTSHIIID